MAAAITAIRDVAGKKKPDAYRANENIRRCGSLPFLLVINNAFDYAV